MTARHLLFSFSVALCLLVSCGGGGPLETASGLDLGGGLFMTADGAILGVSERPAEKQQVPEPQ